jgi:hypothetical protein
LTALALILAACGGNGGGDATGGATGSKGSGGVSGATGGVSGGHAGGGGSNGASGFAGTWTFATGSVTPMCGTVNVPAVDLAGGTATITKVDAGHLTFVFSNPGLTCSVSMTTNGTTASAEAGQTCTLKASGVTAPVAITSWMLTLAGDTISMSMNGTAAVSVLSCTPAGTATLTRAR